MTFAARVNRFNKTLHFDGKLPANIRIMNPFEDPLFYATACSFYEKYYNDNYTRRLILGINPGRLGAGATGIPFTDPKRLTGECGLSYSGQLLHEPSSVFIYEMIAAYGGIADFYRRFYINSVCPLGFVVQDAAKKEKNYNYFDSKALTDAVAGFIEWNIEQQIAMGCSTDTCFCLGLSKNYTYLLELNKRKGYFKQVVPLQHPRFVMQYKTKDKNRYIADYLAKLSA